MNDATHHLIICAFYDVNINNTICIDITFNLYTFCIYYCRMTSMVRSVKKIWADNLLYIYSSASSACATVSEEHGKSLQSQLTGNYINSVHIETMKVLSHDVMAIYAFSGNLSLCPPIQNKIEHYANTNC